MRPYSSTKNSFYNVRQQTFTQSGQIVVEYILLLVIAVTLAVTITSTMVSRNPEEPGFLIVKWYQIIQAIGQDVVDQQPEQGN